MSKLMNDGYYEVLWPRSPRPASFDLARPGIA